MAVFVVHPLEVVHVAQQQCHGRAVALAARQHMGGQGFKVAAVVQAGQRVQRGLFTQAVLGNQHRAAVKGRQRRQHAKHQGDVQGVHPFQADRRQRGERPQPFAHGPEAQVVGQQQHHQRHGIATCVGDHDGGNEQQQVVVKAAVPADEQRAQGGVQHHLQPDQRDGSGVVPHLDQLVRAHVHRDADHIDQRQRHRAQPPEQQDVAHVDGRCHDRHLLHHRPIGLACQAGAALRHRKPARCALGDVAVRGRTGHGVSGLGHKMAHSRGTTADARDCKTKVPIALTGQARAAINLDKRGAVQVPAT